MQTKVNNFWCRDLFPERCGDTARLVHTRRVRHWKTGIVTVFASSFDEEG